MASTPHTSHGNSLLCALCTDSEERRIKIGTPEPGKTFNDFLTYLRNLVSAGGPEPEEYDRITSSLQNLSVIIGSCGLRHDHIRKIRDALGPAMTTESMQGFALHKLYGYAGDFDIIDRIYTQRVSSDARIARWDRFFHNTHAPIAVRNRKTYFKKLLNELLARHKGATQPIRVLNVASGPARDLYEFFCEHGDPRIHFDCIETDPLAINHASLLCKDFLEQITFHQVNAFRFTSDKRYDLVWSAGLFDYFPDRLFVRLLRKLVNLAKSDAELVIGNFGSENKSRAYMELVGDWHLHHREFKKLLSLTMEIGLPAESVTVEQEPSGLNLFLRIVQPNADQQKGVAARTVRCSAPLPCRP